jgi:acetamidase/formamidase
MHHELAVTPAMLHGRFSSSRAPVLQVDSGDTVTILGIPDVSWGLEPPTSTTAPRRKVEPRESGPCLCGPIEIADAAPGDAIEIEIQSIRTTSWGWTYAGAGMSTPGLNAALGLGDAPLTLVRWQIDRERGIARSDVGPEVPLRPFPGTIGLAPSETDACAWTPRSCGGNMDCRELGEGSTLLLPVLADVALLSIGDGHAAQADGELSGTAIECGIESICVRLTLRKDTPLPGPLVLVGNRSITLGFADTLDRAAEIAAGAMLGLIAARKNVSRAQAAAIASAAVSLRITQMVNPLRGVHAIWTE